METSKLQIKIGEIELSAEGEKEWVAAQLDKVLANAERMMAFAPKAPAVGNGDTNGENVNARGANSSPKHLATFLKEKNAVVSQVEKFLATAVWLHAKGTQRLSSRDVSKALSDANQSRLSNPALCLSRNVGKGYCEREGKQFFVTDDGRNSLK